MSLNILTNCLQDNVRILLGDVSHWSLLGVKGLRVAGLNTKTKLFTDLFTSDKLSFLFG